MSTIVGPSDYVLESVNLYYTGHVSITIYNSVNFECIMKL